MAFDSLRARAAGEPLQVSDLFVMNVDDYDETLEGIPDEKQAHVTRGSSASWSPDGRYITFHASDSGVNTDEALARPDPGTPMLDSDIFVLNVDDCLRYRDECLAKEKAGEAGVLPEFMRNITKAHGPATMIDEDPDWSPDGHSIVFTRHLGEDANHINLHSEIFIVDVGSGELTQLTTNAREERAPNWSADGMRVLFMCRGRNALGVLQQFQLCVVEKNSEGLWVETQLTTAGQHLSAQWSPDGQYIIFHRPVPTPDMLPPFYQLFRLTFDRLPDGTPVATSPTRLTSPPGFNGFPTWGKVRVEQGHEH